MLAESGGGIRSGNASTLVLTADAGEPLPLLSTPADVEQGVHIAVSTLASALHEAETPDIAQGTFVVSVQRSGFRRLHVVGGCPRQPGKDYATFEVL